MRITVIMTSSENSFVLDVDSDRSNLEDFKKLCEAETGFPASEIFIVFNGEELQENKKCLKDFGLRDDFATRR